MVGVREGKNAKTRKGRKPERGYGWGCLKSDVGWQTSDTGKSRFLAALEMTEVGGWMTNNH